MSEDLRSQVIEAMADAWARHEEGGDYEMPGAAFASLRSVCAIQLDALLDTLTDNAEAWILAGHRAGDLDDGMHRGDHALVDPLIDALRSPSKGDMNGS